MAYEDEELDYVSSSPLLGGVIKTNPRDEEDQPTLLRVQQLLADQIAEYSTITKLNSRDPNFSVDQQLEVNAKVVAHLSQIKVLVDTIIGDIKEKYQ